jgi:hypothetical protein
VVDLLPERSAPSGAQWNAGCRTAQQLRRELVAQGYQPARRAVERYVGQLRRETGTGSHAGKRLLRPSMRRTMTRAVPPHEPPSERPACFLRNRKTGARPIRSS